MVLACHPSFLQVVRRTIQEFGRLIGFDEEQITQVVAAVDEACANVIRHGYGGSCDEPMLLECRRTDEGLEVRLRDFGRRTDPERLRPFLRGDHKPGGLGLVIIYDAMDSVNFSADSDEGMELRMFKAFRK